jgi:release factor glutamine methyltransferase
MKLSAWLQQESMKRTIELGPFLQSLSRQLTGRSETPLLDAQVLAAHILNKPRSWVLAHPEEEINNSTLFSLEKAASRLVSGEPLPYILGHWEFYGLDFEVTPAVLIPRPETELLVDKALSWLSAHPGGHRLIDIGSGSGCIAVAIGVHSPSTEIYATDLSFQALQVARRNANRHGLAGSIQFVQANLFDGIFSRFDLVCANLPYIPAKKLAALQVAEYEPLQALNGGIDGLAYIRQLMMVCPNFLTPEGLLLMEIETGQGSDVLNLAKTNFPKAEVQLFKDLSGLDRLVTIQLHSDRNECVTTFPAKFSTTRRQPES